MMLTFSHEDILFADGFSVPPGITIFTVFMKIRKMKYEGMSIS